MNIRNTWSSIDQHVKGTGKAFVSMIKIRRKLVLAIGLILLVSWTLTSRQGAPTPNVRESVYEKLFEHLEKTKPIKAPASMKEFRTEDCIMHDVGTNADDIVETSSFENLEKCYHASDVQIESLRNTHSDFIRRIKADFDFPIGSKAFDDLFPVAEGIVTVGGGRYSLLTYTMIKVLRDRGSKLPVEVMIPPQDEGEDQYCNEILPRLNARCLYMSDVLSPSLSAKWELKSYQIKAAALLFSSFKKVLFIDADNFPVKNVDTVFDSEVVRNTGLVLWPDLWRRATPPAFYKIANVEVDLNKRVRNAGDDLSPVSRYQSPDVDENYYRRHVPFHDFEGTVPDPTSETGQLIIDKVRHFHTLLLAFYYNIYGGEWFYYMFSLGTSGQGDKETFAMAAHVLSNPFYQVKTKIDLDGYWDKVKNSGFKGAGMLQHDCVEDYLVHRHARKVVSENYDKYAAYDPSYLIQKDYFETFMTPADKESVDVMFVHASYHKLDPWTLFKEKAFLNSDGTFFRSLSKLGRLHNFDLELFNFQQLEDSLCSKDVIKFKFLEDKFGDEKWPDVCKYISDRVQYLKDSHLDAIGT